VEAAGEEGREAWLATLPNAVLALAKQWSLRVGAPFQPGGRTAWVAPVRDAAGNERVMKVGWRHTEALHEAEGLRAWAGGGTVLLYAAEDLGDTTGLLLEACQPGTPLALRPEPEQDLVVCGLLPRLWSLPTPGHLFRSLEVMCDAWADEFEAEVAAGRSSLDRGLAREGLGLFRSLPRTADREVLLCTDLHAGNVLAAERETWLAIDPKPYVGDPSYDPLQHLLNCEERLQADARALVTRLAGLLDLDADRLALWLFARCVLGSVDRPLLADVAAQLSR
jgi:streptomycin 6-kinase